MTEPQRDEKSGLPMPDPATFPDGGPDPLVEPEHRPDSEWTDGQQPVESVAEQTVMFRPNFEDDDEPSKPARHRAADS